MIFTYEHVTPLRVIDGDTFWSLIDLGNYLTLRSKIRLARINCPERGTDAWQDAKKRLDSMLFPKIDMGYQVINVKCVSIAKPKYAARLICEVILPDGDNVSDIMLAEGLAVPYS